ncbi:isochorismatase family protein [Nocardioides taihuensis]|uniref:Isochorismatase family protein n=1 Tax=Nocardioides taihuensis TaxID=1835606 RepID=A0ABW0BFD5_9ACTN
MSLPAAEALVVVDVQQGWLEGQHAVEGADALLDALRATLAAARAAGALVVHVEDIGDSDSAVPPGSPGRQLVLEVLPGEPVVRKTEGDGFAGSELGDLLRESLVRTVVIGGQQSEMCVAATARGALLRELTVVLPRDCHATRAVPADGDAPAVPAEHVRRVAEWSLGDGVLTPARGADVPFRPAVSR